VQTLLNAGEDVAETGLRNMNQSKVDKCVRAIRHFFHHDSSQPVNSTNPPVPQTSNKDSQNETQTVGNDYNHDGLADVYIQDPIAGSGGGPLIRT
jgi:hypothetical protein